MDNAVVLAKQNSIARGTRAFALVKRSLWQLWAKGHTLRNPEAMPCRVRAAWA